MSGSDAIVVIIITSSFTGVYSLLIGWGFFLVVLSSFAFLIALHYEIIFICVDPK